MGGVGCTGALPHYLLSLSLSLPLSQSLSLSLSLLRERRLSRPPESRRSWSSRYPHRMLQKNSGGGAAAQNVTKKRWGKGGTYRDIVRVTCKLIDAPELV